MKKEEFPAVGVFNSHHTFISRNTFVGYRKAVHIEGGTSNSVTDNLMLSAEVAQLYADLQIAVKSTELPVEVKEKIGKSVEEMRKNTGSPNFSKKYKEFVSSISDHMQVLGPVLNEYIPKLTDLL